MAAIELKLQRKEFAVCRLAAAAALIFLAALLVYLPRLAATVQESDGGELVTAAVTHSLPHPPGYPIHAAVSRMLVDIFPANPYQTVSAFSAVMQAAAGVLLFLLCYSLTDTLLLSLSCSAAWLLYEPVMRSAVDAEVFGLHHFLIFLVVLLAWRLTKSTNPQLSVLLLGTACGLGGAHHSTIVLWAPLVIAAAVSRGLALGGAKGLLKLSVFLLAGALIGLLPYLYLLTLKNSIAFSPLESLSDLARHALRSEYGTFSMHPSSSSGEVSYLPHFIKTTFLTAPLLCIGYLLVLFPAFSKRSAFCIGVALSALLNIWFASKLVVGADTKIFGEFIMRMYGMLGACGAVCVITFAAFYKQELNKYIALLLILPALIVLPHNLVSCDNRADRTVDHELNAILDEIPTNGVFMNGLDRIGMGLAYKQYVLGKRNDIVVIVPSMLGSRSYRDVLLWRAVFLKNFDFSDSATLNDFVTYIESRGRTVSAYRETPPPSEYGAWPIGITWQWLPKGTTVTYGDLAKKLLAFCSRWPDDLLDVSPFREESNAIIQILFFDPIRELKEPLKDAENRLQLNKIVEAFDHRDIPGAKNLCKAALHSERPLSTSP
jgi:hypothetical protein